MDIPLLNERSYDTQGAGGGSYILRVLRFNVRFAGYNKLFKYDLQ